MRSLFLLAVAGVLSAQQSEYFPLQSGNTWVYKVSGRAAVFAQPVTMTVMEQVTIDGVDYWELGGVPGIGRAILRVTSSGTLAAYDENTKTESPWLAFRAAVGEDFESRVHPCVGSGSIVDRAAKEALALGAFDNLLQVRYGNFTCADAGITADLFAPNIGLARRVETTIAGPRAYELIYARIGGTTVLTQPEQSFTVALDRAVYEAGKPVDILARLSLRNSMAEPIDLFFASGQTFNFVVRDEKGDVLYNWEALRLFIPVTQLIRVKGEKVWNASFDVPSSLAPGRYTLEAVLTTSPPRYKSTVSFEVK